MIGIGNVMYREDKRHVERDDMQWMRQEVKVQR